MCGIAGIVGFDSDANRHALTSMLAAMEHRGPDGQGSWFGPASPAGNRLLLGHRRLSILDLSSAAAQPMGDSRSGDVVSMNGEIYNYRELRRLLEKAGHRFQSTGDTEVLLKLLVDRGLSAVASLRGMFSFAYWNARERQLSLVRDPFGIKPLYFTANTNSTNGWKCAFASEVRSLLESGLIKNPRLDRDAPRSIVWNGFVAGPNTVVDQIRSVAPGAFVTIDADGEIIRSGRWWEAGSSHTEEASTEEECAYALRESIQQHLVSDVPLAVFLSSGVDSSSVANLAARVADTRINTFTLSFEESEYNEGVIAGRIAQAIGASHEEVLLTEGAVIGDLEGGLRALDQPSFDGMNSYFMSMAIREAGFRVALVGTGGDELFGGYSSFRDLRALYGLQSVTRWLPADLKVKLAGFVLGLSRVIGLGGYSQARWEKMPAMLECGIDMTALYQVAYALYLPSFQDQLLTESARGRQRSALPGELLDQLAKELSGRSVLSKISVLEQRLFLGERLLRDTDAVSMAASIETRLPLVDARLFEVIDRLPDSSRYFPLRKKELLRRIGLKGLDADLFARRKQGFELPYERWMKSSLGSIVSDALMDSVALEEVGLEAVQVQKLVAAYRGGEAKLYWSRLWAIFVYVFWCKRFGLQLST